MCAPSADAPNAKYQRQNPVSERDGVLSNSRDAATHGDATTGGGAAVAPYQ